MNPLQYLLQLNERAIEVNDRLAALVSEHDGTISRSIAPSVLHHARQLADTAWLRLEASRQIADSDIATQVADTARADMRLSSWVIERAKAVLT